MLSEAEGSLYMAGFDAYDPHRGEGFRQNPYLYGPGREEEARQWWQGYAMAREQARLDNRRAAS